MQLFERPILDAAPADRHQLLSGAAALAAPVLGISTSPGDAATSEFAALHGLYWLCANLADRGPMLLVLDDLHWCDRESLRWVSYFARRIEGVRAGLLLAARPAEPGAATELVQTLATERGVVALAPQPLSAVASAELLRGVVGEHADEAFLAGAHRAAGGNPLLLRELTGTLGEEGIPPDAQGTQRLEQVAPVSVALGRLRFRAPALVVSLGVVGVDAVDGDVVAAALEDLDGRTRWKDDQATLDELRSRLEAELGPEPYAEGHELSLENAIGWARRARGARAACESAHQADGSH